MKPLAILTLAILMLTSSPSSAYSNDPNGDMFISRSSFDFSNCGPITALMLSKLVKPESEIESMSESIDSARRVVQTNDGDSINYRWWRNGDIKNYLKHEKISHNAVDTRGLTNTKRQDKIINAVKKGETVVINVNMNHLPLSLGSGVGKPYFTVPFITWGHFLVIVGYEEINGKMAYEVHDSYSKKGKNRMYYADNINKAISRYNNELIVVAKTETPKVTGSVKLISN